MRPSSFFTCNLLAAIIAISTALLTTVGLFAETGLPEIITAFGLRLVAVTAGLAILIGLINLFWVHLGRLFRWQKGSIYSLVLLLTAITVIVIRVLNLETSDTGEAFSPRLFEALQVSLEASLAGLASFFLVYALYRYTQGAWTWNGCLFIAAFMIALMGAIPFPGLELMAGLRTWLLEIPSTAGARGILIGIALATLTVGLRVLVGQDQSYRES
jgi:hypothetical protein